MDDDDYEPGFLFSIIMISVAIAAFASIAMWATTAFSHEAPSGMKYDGWCCNGNNHTGDCQPIPSSSVKVVRGGYQITLEPGDHRLVTEPHVFQKPQAETRPSTDGEYHACLYPTEDTLRCLYVPPVAF